MNPVDSIVKDARLRDYGEGVIDGFRITLQLLNGEPVDGGVPYQGPRPSELQAWIDNALSKILASEGDAG